MKNHSTRATRFLAGAALLVLASSPSVAQDVAETGSAVPAAAVAERSALTNFFRNLISITETLLAEFPAQAANETGTGAAEVAGGAGSETSDTAGARVTAEIAAPTTCVAAARLRPDTNVFEDANGFVVTARGEENCVHVSRAGSLSLDLGTDSQAEVIVGGTSNTIRINAR